MNQEKDEKPKYQTRTISFGGRKMTLYSIDGNTWSSRVEELELFQERIDNGGRLPVDSLKGKQPFVIRKNRFQKRAAEDDEPPGIDDFEDAAPVGEIDDAVLAEAGDVDVDEADDVELPIAGSKLARGVSAKVSSKKSGDIEKSTAKKDSKAPAKAKIESKPPVNAAPPVAGKKGIKPAAVKSSKTDKGVKGAAQTSKAAAPASKSKPAPAKESGKVAVKKPAPSKAPLKKAPVKPAKKK